MDRGELQKKAAEAIRELVNENDKLRQDQAVYQECVKLAFELADSGQIDNSYESITQKAQELFGKQEDLPVIKKAMEYNTRYLSVGDLEKRASTSERTDAKDIFETILRKGI